MKDLALLRFEGLTRLVFIDQLNDNNLAVISDINGNKKNFSMDYITDLSSHPEQKEKAYKMFDFAEFFNGSIF
jgi:hypothetical protein